MRIDLPNPLKTGEVYEINIHWAFNIIEEAAIGGRGGYEHFPKSDTYLYFLAQWYPRVAALTDYAGWQHKAFLGSGEFTLEFGDYDVEITVPADHIVSSTGELQNPEEVLSAEQRTRLAKANSKKITFIVTPEEAIANEKEGTGRKKRWHFRAENVRDFAWTASKKFIWDALAYETTDGKKVMCMSYYPKEAYPIYRRYSSKAVRHTLNVYSRYSIPYPYPVAIENKREVKATPVQDDITRQRNRDSDMKFVVEEDKELQDFYTNYKPWETRDSAIEISGMLYGDTYSKKKRGKNLVIKTITSFSSVIREVL